MTVGSWGIFTLGPSLLRWVCYLHWLPEFPRRCEPLVPTVVTALLTSCISFSLILPHSPAGGSWDCLPNLDPCLRLRFRVEGDPNQDGDTEQEQTLPPHFLSASDTLAELLGPTAVFKPTDLKRESRFHHGSGLWKSTCHCVGRVWCVKSNFMLAFSGEKNQEILYNSKVKLCFDFVEGYYEIVFSFAHLLYGVRKWICANLQICQPRIG